MKTANVVFHNPVLVIMWVLVLATADIQSSEPDNLTGGPTAHAARTTEANPLNVLSLNIAHGRGTSVNQILLSEEEIRKNLVNIAQLLKREEADIVALQEADAPSPWSGNFDHIKFLATEAEYPEVAHSIQSSSMFFNFGTAILSRLQTEEVLHHTFSVSPPTLNKGFTLARIDWNPTFEPDSTISVIIVSVHLDFSRMTVREKQLTELISILSGRENPMIVMGDLNSDYFHSDDTVRRLATDLRLQAHHPEATNLGTYRSNNRRLDWILISDNLKFVEYGVVDDVVSDHLAVYASIVVD